MGDDRLSRPYSTRARTSKHESPPGKALCHQCATGHSPLQRQNPHVSISCFLHFNYRFLNPQRAFIDINTVTRLTKNKIPFSKENSANALRKKQHFREEPVRPARLHCQALAKQQSAQWESFAGGGRTAQCQGQRAALTSQHRAILHSVLEGTRYLGSLRFQGLILAVAGTTLTLRVRGAV